MNVGFADIHTQFREVKAEALPESRNAIGFNFSNLFNVSNFSVILHECGFLNIFNLKKIIL